MLNLMSDCYRSIYYIYEYITALNRFVYIYFPSIEYWNRSVKIVYRLSQRGDTFNELYYEKGLVSTNIY